MMRFARLPEGTWRKQAQQTQFLTAATLDLPRARMRSWWERMGAGRAARTTSMRARMVFWRSEGVFDGVFVRLDSSSFNSRNNAMISAIDWRAGMSNSLWQGVAHLASLTWFLLRA